MADSLGLEAHITLAFEMYDLPLPRVSGLLKHTLLFVLVERFVRFSSRAEVRVDCSFGWHFNSLAQLTLPACLASVSNCAVCDDETGACTACPVGTGLQSSGVLCVGCPLNEWNDGTGLVCKRMLPDGSTYCRASLLIGKHPYAHARF